MQINIINNTIIIFCSINSYLVHQLKQAAKYSNCIQIRNEKFMTIYQLFVNAGESQTAYNNINLVLGQMKRNPQTDIKLYSHRQCQQKCNFHSQKGLKQSHWAIQYDFLQSLLKQCMNNNRNSSQVDKVYNELKKMLVSLRDSIEDALSRLQNDAKFLNLQCQYGLTAEAACACLAIITPDQNQQDLDDIRCCDIYQIYQKFVQGETNKLQPPEQQSKIIRLVNKTISKIQPSLSSCLNYPKKIQARRVDGQRNIGRDKQRQRNFRHDYKKQTSKKEAVHYDDGSDTQQCRPTRASQREIRTPRPDERRQPNKSGPPLVKMQDIKGIPEGNKLFNIKVKILKIVKKFKIHNDTKIQFTAGDETGTGVCVVDSNPLIKQNDSILITNCRIYMFQDRIRQIQTTKNTQIAKIADIKSINFTVNMTRDNDKRNPRPRQQREYAKDKSDNSDEQIVDSPRPSPRKQSTKEKNNHEKSQQGQDEELTLQLIEIKDIEPDSQNITFVAQIYKVVEDQQQEDKQPNGVTCIIGDQTGIVKAVLPLALPYIKQGYSIKLKLVDSKVINQHIQIRLNKNSKIQKINVKFPVIKIQNDISEQEWVAQVESDVEQNEQ